MNLHYQFISVEKFNPLFAEYRRMLFSDNFDFNVSLVMTESEKLLRGELNQCLDSLKEYYLIAQDNDKLVGWSFGIQRTADDFYMINSAIFPEYRRKGIYRELMRRAVEHLSSLGFQRIYSRHKMSNNDILIPKLKFGFVITGFEVNDMFGNLVELSYYTNPRRRELLDIRMGMRKPSDEDMKLIR